jgi:hypothetical protein
MSSLLVAVRQFTPPSCFWLLASFSCFFDSLPSVPALAAEESVEAFQKLIESLLKDFAPFFLRFQPFFLCFQPPVGSIQPLALPSRDFHQA